MALSLCPLLTQGQIEALRAPRARRRSRRSTCRSSSAGAWTGTMNLTEPQAGSDVGAVRARAEPLDGRQLRGHRAEDLHLLGRPRHRRERLPPGAGAAAGRTGRAPGGSRSSWCRSSCPTPTGGRASGTAVRALSLEHKIGLHGSPTCVMEYDRARGWLIGEPHRGMAAMFTMMNNARLARRRRGPLARPTPRCRRRSAFARERRQGRTPDGRADDHRPCRRAADAPDHGRAHGHRPRDLPRLRPLDRHGHGHRRGGLAGARRASSPRSPRPSAPTPAAR